MLITPPIAKELHKNNKTSSGANQELIAKEIRTSPIPTASFFHIKIKLQKVDNIPYDINRV